MDKKLFKIENGTVTELIGQSVAVEKSLQTLIEAHLYSFLGVRFIASEYSTGKTHGGRIDTLGIDENGCPVIVEYKRALNENVINQGLFYLDWLLDHKGEFTLEVLRRFGTKEADTIEWSSPRLLCIAGDFTKYDEYAVQQINRNIELLRYRRYGDDLLLLELVNVVNSQDNSIKTNTTSPTKSAKASISTTGNVKTVTDYLDQANTTLTDRFEALKAFLLNLGDDVQLKTLKHYIAFKRIKNFACIEIHPQSNKLVVYVKVEPTPDLLEKNFTRDVRNVGHYGTGELEIILSNDNDLERAKPFLIKSYEAS